MPKQKTLSQLKRQADKLFSQAIRYRDCEFRDNAWIGQCITCERWLLMSQAHAGHFMSRRFGATRYDEMNVNLQCPGCNTFNAGEQYRYGLEIDTKYGRGTARKLYKQAHSDFKMRRDFLEEVIHDAKEEIKFYQKI